MPLRLERAHELALLLRGHAPEDAVAGRRGLDFGRCIELGGVDIGVRVGDAHHLGDARDRARVVARDDVQAHTLLVEVADGFLGRGPDLVADGDEPERLHGADDITLVGEPVHAGHEQHAGGLCECGDLGLDLLELLVVEHELRGAHHKGAGGERGPAPFLGRGEGHDRERLEPLLERVRIAGEYRLAGFVRVGRRGPGNACEGALDVLDRASALPCRLKRVDALDLHGARGDGARLVEAEHVDARERFDAVELLREHLAAREAHGRDGEDRGREKHEALRDHAEQGAHGGEQGRANARVAREISLERPEQKPVAALVVDLVEAVQTRPEEREAERHHDHARKAHDGVQRAHDLGIDLLDVLGLVVDLRDVVVGPHVDHARADEARVHEAAAHELGARELADEVALAREKALVHQGLARHDDGVGGDLVAAAETDDVVEDDLVEVDLALGAVAHDGRALAGEERELVDHALGAQRLHRADSGVQEDDEQEAEVLP